MHNHSEHLTGLYTRDGHRVTVNKDRNYEEDDVSTFFSFWFCVHFNGLCSIIVIFLYNLPTLPK